MVIDQVVIDQVVINQAVIDEVASGPVQRAERPSSA